MPRAAAAPRLQPGRPAHPASPSLPQTGDKVVYSKYAGTELEVQGGNYVLLKVRRRWKLPDRGVALLQPVGGSAAELGLLCCAV